jgi:uncharacterized protein YfaS (alpha-2-macroglobulin family)
MKPSTLRRPGIALFVLALATAFSAEPEVQWLAEDETLSPSTTLEVRFAREMIARDLLGIGGAESPLVFKPALAGKYTWLSTRSGVFVPGEAPKMGTVFAVSLRAGLKDTAGQPIGAKWRATLRTPPFAITAIHNGVQDPKEAPAQPEVRIGFNREVKLEGAEKLFRFVGEKGASVAATVRYATPRDHFGIAAEDDDWERRWQLAHAAVPADESGDSEDEDGDGETVGPPLRNRLIVLPAGLLTPGGAWRLEFKGGIESLTGGYQIKEKRTIELGRVQPFTVTAITASSYLNSGRSARIEFSGRLGEDVDEETASKFFRVTPEVKNLRFEPDFKAMILHGDFERGADYRVEFDPALLSESGLPLSGERARTFRFGPVKPRIYFPEITGHQSANGRRKFPVLSVNLRELRVIARRVEPEKVGAAIVAFAKYHKDFDANAPDEQYQALPPDLITGAVVLDKTIAIPSGEIDARQETALDWDELGGRGMAGAFFLTIEGQPIAEAGGKRPGAQAFIQLTDLGVLWKRSGAQLRASVFSMANGAPLADVKVSVLDEDLAALSTGQTDGGGAVAITLGAGPAWLFVQRGGDSHTLSIGAGGELPMAAFGVPIDYSDYAPREQSDLPLRVLLFTDRPLYRPGEMVRVKGIARSIGDDGPAIAARVNARLVMYAPHDRGETTIDITTDERGAFDAQFALAASTTGTYGLNFKIGERSYDYASFQAADFQPNAFELNVAMQPRFAPGAAVAAEVTGKYFFGAPLAKATVRWTLQHAPADFEPSGFIGYTFGSGADPVKSIAQNGEGELPANGAFAIRPQLPETKVRPLNGVLTVEVTDANQQTVSEARRFVRDAADFYVGLKLPDESVIGHAEEIVARAVAVKPDGKPVGEPVPVKVELLRVRYNTVRAQGAGGAITFHNERIEEPVASADGRTLVAVRDGAEWRLPDGESARLKPGKAGEYVLRVSATDPQGRATMAQSSFSVSGTEAISWDYRNPAQIDLVPDKAEYRVGATARILVKTPIAGEALVSIERGSRILRQQRVRLEGNAPTFDVPIAAGDGPNVFVSLMLLRGAEQSTRKFKTPEYRYGVCALRVGDPGWRLEVEIAPAAATVEPGEEVAADVRVRDGNGAAVADAEVTAWAVDDGVLALTGYERPQPRTTFHAPLPLAIRTGISLFTLLPEDPADLEYANKGYLIGGGGVEGPGPKLRSDFPGTACWFPALRTDKDGRATLRFKAPDALTRYRLVAVAHAGAMAFGSGESAFTIRKKLMLLSALGQAANVGDEIIARAVLRNESGAAGSAEVALVLDSTAESAQPLVAKFAMKDGEMRSVDFPVKLRATGDAGWKWTARLEGGGKVFEDAMAAALRVGSPVPVLRETYLSELSEKADLLAGVNPQLIEGEGAVRVTVSNTRLATLRETAAALLEYPYGCAEQTVSALIPWITLNDLGPVLPELAKTKDDIRKVVRSGIDKLFAMQTDGGGLAYWPGGRRASLFASAYAVLALANLEKQGEPLPAGYAMLVESLGEQLRGLGETRSIFDLEDGALGVFALAVAGKAEPAYHEQLFSRRAELSLESRALVALAAIESNTGANMIPKLLDPRAKAPDSFSWFGSAARERAVRLMAWTRFAPKDREVDRLAKELLASRAGGRWRTTQENAWAMLALSRYFRDIEREVQPADGAIVKAGVAAPFSLTKKEMTKSVKLAFDAARPLGSLTVENPQRRPLFGEASFIVRPPVAEQPRQDRGYAVSRTYRKVAADGALAEASDLRVGDRVLVTLRIETRQPGHFIAIDDPLPAVFEAINPDFRAAAAGAARDFYASDYREIRADRVLYFCDHLPAGAFTFQYLARVRTAGRVTAPPTKVEEMYRPERFGLSGTAKVEAR